MICLLLQGISRYYILVNQTNQTRHYEKPRP